MRSYLPPLLFSLACSPVSLDVEDKAVRVTSPDSGASTPDTGAESVIEEVGGVDGESFSAWIYDPDVVHTLDISMSQESFIALYTESVAYNSDYWVEADITYDGELVEQVGVRLKGRWGSWRSVYGKAAFKIDFNHYVDGQVFYGLKGLTLNNMVIDYSYQREHLAYKVYEAMGLPWPRNAYTWVTLNGSSYGLYLNVETADDVYLNRFYPEPEGNLYDADYIMWDDGSYTVLDFYSSLATYFEQEEGEDNGGSDISAVAELIDNNLGSSTFYEETASLVDWDHHARLVASEMWTGQVDGYSLNQNNYLVYFDPSDGRVDVLPWDHDYAFVHESYWGFSWYYPRGRLAGLCISDPSCLEDLKVQIQAVNAAVEELDLGARMQEVNDLIWPYIVADPRKEAGMDYTIYYQDVISAWIDTRSEELESMWGLEE